MTAQVAIINRSLTDSSLNIAYVGVDNAIEIIGHKVVGKLDFSTTNGAIRDLGKNRYVLNPNPDRQGQSIVGFYINGKKIASKTFRIDTLGNLIARLAGVRESFATVQEIISNPFLVLEFPKTFFKHNFYIRSFELTMDAPDIEDIDPYVVTRDIIPSNAIDKIKKMRRGSEMLFDQIIVLCPDCGARKLQPFKIIIK